MADLRQAFRPEFLNRVDETVLFKPLSLEEIGSIVTLLIADINQRLADRHVVVVLDAKAKTWVAEKGYDPVFGARPLKRAIQRDIENPVAKLILEGRFGPKDVIPVDFEGEDFSFARVVH